MPLSPSSMLRRVAVHGFFSSLVSGLLLLLRGRKDVGSAAAPVNAVSHWLWPHTAFQADAPSLRHTLTGAVVHYGASMFWGLCYDALRRRRARPTTANALGDAVAVSAAAAVVDLVLVPPRLRPGFERRLRPRSLCMVYGGFALGLALGGLLAPTRPRPPGAWQPRRDPASTDAGLSSDSPNAAERLAASGRATLARAPGDWFGSSSQHGERARGPGWQDFFRGA